MVRARKSAGERESSDGKGFSRPFNWLDRKLLPVLGPPKLGPWDEAAEAGVDCPICGFPMAEHTIDRSTQNAILNCPGEPLPVSERDADGPLNELGMPKGDHRDGRRRA